MNTDALRDLSERSRIAIAADYSRYEAWCGARGLIPLPASADQLEAWLTDTVHEGLKLATIKRFVYSIGQAHAVAGFVSPTRMPVWKSHWRRISSKLEAFGLTQTTKREKLNADDIQTILASLGDSLGDLRDAALLTVASDTLYRPAELVALCIEHIVICEDGSAEVRPAYQRDTPVSFQGIRPLSTNTLHRVHRWCEAMNIRQGPVFLAIGGRPKRKRTGSSAAMEPPEVTRIIQRRAAAAGLQGAFSAYSTRVGAVHDLARAGATVREIQAAGGWRTPHVISHRTWDIEGMTEALRALKKKL